MPRLLASSRKLALEQVLHVQGLMRLLMKERNGEPWSREDTTQIRIHLKQLAASLPMLGIFVLPGGSFLLPLLAWYLDRRRSPRGPDR
jgi:hypothetical protein